MLGAAVVAAGATACTHAGIGHNSSAPAQPATATALAPLLEQVRIVERIRPVAGYDRGCGKSQSCVYGPAWNDPDNHSGCDTRSRLLASSLRNVEFKPGTHNCKPIAGTLDPDPYTGQTVDLRHVEADHVYPLRRSWDAGAWQWNPKQRQTFANDLTELIAVSEQANRAKSDAGLNEWLPSYRPCDYIQRYLTVAIKYQLPITTAERSTAVNTCRSTTGPANVPAKA
ncbi:HNH endonuclease [Mycobacterium intracellulare]|uniref:HNH endonuclease family protein n=1 Tax=Mycobacterium intracellulare TaxID=1767 RepID=UPI001CD9AAAA|nr:HNH endonuclease family protein [Mycobacterium intracellulare]MCA2247578.1 HNH endonuclease [Mycobacterium intracellulare]